MAHISVDFQKPLGKIKPMHAVGQPPFGDVTHPMFHYLTEANIPYSRLHDIGDPYVDIPYLFRDFDADETDPASYDFAFTDVLLTQMAKANVKPIFRLGVTIENFYFIRSYHIDPPTDPAKWARVCEHVIRHYNEGWADGYHLGIEYWEIWNEPENGEMGKNQMWTGTDEQYFELYDVTAKHLKACFGDSIRVGGFAATSFRYIFSDPARFGLDGIVPRTGDRYTAPKEKRRERFHRGFFEYIRAHGSPLDFFTWHSYESVEDTEIMADFADRLLTEYGYGEVETHLNEWNNAARVKRICGSAYASAAAGAMMIAMHAQKTDMLCYYDARFGFGEYAGMINVLTAEPHCLYHTFRAFGYLYELGTQVMCEYERRDGLYAIAATDECRQAMLVVNFSEKSRILETNLSEEFTLALIDEENALTPAGHNPACFPLAPNQVALITKGASR